MALNDLLAAIDNDATQSQRQGLTLSTNFADSFGVNPDDEAQRLKLQETTGTPAALMDEDARRNAEMQQYLARPELQALPSHPVAASWFENAENAKVAADDVETLTKVEKSVGNFVNNPPTTWGYIQQQFTSGQEGAILGKTARERSQRGEKASVSEDLMGERVKLAQRDRERDLFGKIVGGGLNFAGQMYESLKGATDEAAIGLAAGTAAGAMISGPFAPVAGPAVGLAGAGAGLAVGFFKEMQQVEYGNMVRNLEEVRGAGGETLDPNLIQNIALTYSLGSAAVESVSFGILSAPFKRLVREKLGQEITKQLTKRAAVLAFVKGHQAAAVSEAGEELVQQVLESTLTNLAKGVSEGDFEQESAGQIIEQAGQAFVDTYLAMLIPAGFGPGANLRGDLRAAKSAERNRAFFSSLGESAQASKLNQRLPAKFQDLVKRIKEQHGGKVDTVFIPSERFTSFFQEAGVDPDQVARELGLSDYTEAIAAGADVAIPLEVYASKLAGSEFHQGLIDDLKFSPDEMTAREAEEFRATVQERFSELLDGVETTDSSRQVYDDILGQLLGAGVERTAAERQALLQQARYRTRAERLGVDAFELYNEAPLRIGRPLPEFMTRRDFVDTSVDPLLDRLRTGDLPKESAVYGESLGDFLRMKGVRDEGGELASLGVDQGLKPFQRKMVQGNGLALDKAREAAEEAGYLQPGSTVADLLDAIDRDARGQRVYAPQNTDVEGERLLTDLNQFKELLDRLGVDLAAMDNQAVRGKVEELLASPEMFQTLSEINLKIDDVLINELEPGHPITHKPGEDARTVYKAYREGYSEDPIIITSDGVVIDGNGRYANAKASGDDTIKAIRLPITDAELRDNPAFTWSRAAAELSKYVYERSGYTLRAKAIVEESSDYWNDDLAKELLGGTFDPNNPDIRYQSFTEGKRGSITFTDSERIIALFEKADLSTVLHELSHSWLEELRQDALRDGAPQQLQDDWQTIAGWLGLQPDVDAIPVEAHEQFARGGEAYLMEGKAPSAELMPAFQRFRAWLVRIYRTVSGLRVQLNDDVRGVFDRLLATDEQIAAAREIQGLTPIFATAEDAGMTETEFTAYRKDVEKAHAAETAKLQARMMAELQREQERWWKDERAKVKAEVEDEAKQNPVYRAFQVLTKGKDFDGKQAPDGFKLSKAVLVKMYGKEFVSKLPRSFRYVYANEGGLHPDEVATYFGYRSGDEMIQAMANTPAMALAVEAETTARMRQTYGDLLNDGSLAEEALKAVHSDEQGKVLRAELLALRKRQREVAPFVRAAKQIDWEESRDMLAGIPPLEAYKLIAAQTIGAKTLGEIRPYSYLQAERKAGKLAFEAAAAKNWTKALSEKQKQLMNHYLYLEAVAAREEADKVADYASDLQKPAAQKRIGKAGGSYLEQINGLLERYEFKRQTQETLAKRQTLLEWVRQQEEMGLEPSIPEEIIADAGRRNYRTLTIDELRAVRDALRNIEHLAREVNKVRTENEEMELADAVQELTLSALLNMKSKVLPIDPETRSYLEKNADRLSRMDASLIKPEQLFEWLDGGKVDGPWQRLIFRPLAAAQAKENDLTLTYTQRLFDLLEQYAKGVDLMEKRHIASIGQPLTRQALLAVALNTGNESNYTKLLDGRGWSTEVVREITSHLDKADWEFVQSVWDLIEELWPEIEALEKRLTGVAPPKIQAREFTNAHGTFRGGYYPVVYDPRHSAAGEKQSDARGDKLFDADYVRATTEKGHTKARVEGAAGPLLLSIEIIPQHLAQVIHDLTHREAIVTANRLLTQKDLRQTLNETLGPAYVRMLRQWLAHVANDRNVDRTGNEFWAGFLNGLRTNATVVAMGFKATTMFAQIAGLSQSLDIVRGDYLAGGMKAFLRNPLKSLEWVAEKSGEMRHRRNSLDRDIRDGLRKHMGKHGPRQWVQAKAFAGVALFDAMVSVPTWIGAYNQAKAQGMTEGDAVATADKAVRLSQGAGAAKDLAAVQRGNDLMKLFTMFYSYFSVLYARLRNMGHLKSVGEISYLDMAWKSFVMVMLPAVLGELLAGRGPDDEEDKAAWVLRKIAFYPFLTVPLLRDAANTFDSGRPYQLTPLARIGEQVTKLPDAIEAVVDGRKDVEDLVFQFMDVPGYFFGLPTGQVRATGRYLWDVMEGDVEPEGMGDVLSGLLFGK